MKLKKGLLLFTLSILVIGQFLPTMSVIAETIDESTMDGVSTEAMPEKEKVYFEDYEQDENKLSEEVEPDDNFPNYEFASEEVSEEFEQKFIETTSTSVYLNSFDFPIISVSEAARGEDIHIATIRYNTTRVGSGLFTSGTGRIGYEVYHPNVNFTRSEVSVISGDTRQPQWREGPNFTNGGAQGLLSPTQGSVLFSEPTILEVRLFGNLRNLPQGVVQTEFTNLGGLSSFITRHQTYSGNGLQPETRHIENVSNEIIVDHMLLTTTHQEKVGQIDGTILRTDQTYLVPGAEYEISPKKFENYVVGVLPENAIGVANQSSINVKIPYMPLLTATGIPQIVEVGHTFSNSNAIDLVTDVKFGNSNLSNSNGLLRFEIASQAETSLVGETEVIVRITRTISGGNDAIVEVIVPVTVTNSFRVQTETINDWHRDEPVRLFTAEFSRGTNSPIMYITANNSVASRLWDFQAGMAHYVLKDSDGNVIPSSGRIVTGTNGISIASSQFFPEVGNFTLEVYARIPAVLASLSMITTEDYFDFGQWNVALSEGEVSNVVQTVTTLESFLARAGVLELNYVTSKGDPLAEQERTHGRPGDNYTTETRTFEGYRLKEVVGNPIGEYTTQTTVVTYIYEEIPGILEIQKVSHLDFEFGNVKQSSRNQTVSAIGEEAPTITISDYSDATQWSLYASASPFRSETSQELRGAGITLKDLKIVESVHSWITVPSRDVLLSTTPQLMGIMANPNGIYGDEHGQTIIQIGEAKNDSLTGVSLNLPANTAMDPGTYQTTITWELVGDPTIGGSR